MSSRIVLPAAALLLIAATPGFSNAQSNEPRARSLELRLLSGALIPTGAQRQQLQDAQATAAQVSWLIRPQVALTGTFGWARSRDIAAAGTPKLDVFTSDVGAEFRSSERFTSGPVSVSTFAGLGAGARSYNYRTPEIATSSHLAGYASVGGELGLGKVGLRVEVRDYATKVQPRAGGESATRNDVVVLAALRFNRQRAPQR